MKSAADVFQDAIRLVLPDLGGVINVRRDILIRGGGNVSERDRRLLRIRDYQPGRLHVRDKCRDQLAVDKTTDQAIPNNYKNERFHQGHQGYGKTKAPVHSKVCFPLMNDIVEKVAKF